jgi:crotonobetainyl-CoA:carnitine CoA-transferase CaiB-like acyl-CoA transferase
VVLFSLNVSNPKLVYARHLGYISVDPYGHEKDLEMGGGMCHAWGEQTYIRKLGLYT